jgi:hypothetical protein
MQQHWATRLPAALVLGGIGLAAVACSVNIDH